MYIEDYFYIVYILAAAAAAYVIAERIFWWYVKKKRAEYYHNQEKVLLQIRVTKENEKGPLFAEQMLASLHGIQQKMGPMKKFLLMLKGADLQDYFSFEMATISQNIRFYVWCSRHLASFVENQVYAQYSDIEIEEVEDYSDIPENMRDRLALKELAMEKTEFLPIKTYTQFEDVDPLSSITSALAEVNKAEEQLWIQFICRPIDASWQKEALRYISCLRKGKEYKPPKRRPVLLTLILIPFSILNWFISVARANKAGGEESKTSSEGEDMAKNIFAKANKLGYEVKIRIAYLDPLLTAMGGSQKIQSVASSFKQFNIQHSNGFKTKTPKKRHHLFFRQPKTPRENWLAYHNRFFQEGKGNIFNIEEVASIFHLPNQNVKTPNIFWVASRKTEPPQNLPIIKDVLDPNITILGVTNFRRERHKFGIKMIDRRRHIYILGKTGMGKSTFMENMVYSDIVNGRGVGFVDPHGDAIDNIINFIPKHRVNDVVIFDPADREFPVALNILETQDKEQGPIVASGIVGIFKKIYGDSWGPRLEYILRNTLLALLETSNMTLLGVPRMYIDKGFREKIISKVTDPIVKSFWEDEWKSWQPKQIAEAVSPIQNKVGQFLSNPLVRNILGQPKSAINLRTAMDEKKIILVKLSKGKIGEDNMALLGSMIITQFYLAAMSRADMAADDRIDFYLYVDEFQNFATPAFASILSEARKYKLNLTMANQYVAQMPDEVKDAVFGNVGTMLTFQAGYDDALYMSKQFSEVVSEKDVEDLGKYAIYIRLLVDNIPSPVFSAQTMASPAETQDEDQREKIIKVSRERYARTRDFVETKIAKWAEKSKEQLAEEKWAKEKSFGKKSFGGGSGERKPFAKYPPRGDYPPRPASGQQGKPPARNPQTEGQKADNKQN